METKIICTLCGEEMKETEWAWGDEDAHKECVIKESNYHCKKKCGYMSTYPDELCECGAKLIRMSPEDKEFYRKER